MDRRPLFCATIFLCWFVASCANEQAERRAPAAEGKSLRPLQAEPIRTSPTAPARRSQDILPAEEIPDLKSSSARVPAQDLIQTSANSSTGTTVVAAKDSMPATAKEIVDRSIAFYLATPTYTCRSTRQERVGGKLQPRETMQMDFRLNPRSVHYTWIDETYDGRECVYSEGANDNKIVTRGGKADLLFTGKVMRVDPNGFLAKGRGRYSITESGIDSIVRRLESTVAAIESGDRRMGTVELRGLTKREELQTPSIEILQTLPQGSDPAFSMTATRRWYFEPQSAQLQLLISHDMAGNLQEYYRFDRLIPNPAICDKDFDPVALWPGSKPGTATEKSAN